MPTLLCGAPPWKHFESPRELAQASIAIVYGFNRTRVRYMLARQPISSYLKDMTLALRLVLSLRAVRTALPIQLLVSGERHAEYESLFTAQGVAVIDVVDRPPPHWANPWHAATFTKLAALSYAAAQSAKLIVLDVDMVVLRNVDHLRAAPAPAFAYHVSGCNGAPTRCCGDLNSGLMVLRSSTADARRAADLFEELRLRRHVSGDGGDQSFWRMFYPRVHELPSGYNAKKQDRANWTNTPAEVAILHDMWPHRWARWWVGPWRRWVDNLTTVATRLMRQASLEVFVKARRKGNATRQSACYSKELMQSICAHDS